LPRGLLELELLELDPHGSIATVWVSVLRGITISLEPGGIVLLPDCATDASEHDSTASVSGLCCFGITTVLTPGFCSAVATGSELELLLLPQPATAAIAAHVTEVTLQRAGFWVLYLPVPAPSSARFARDAPAE
jgi:hypothetical protein